MALDAPPDHNPTSPGDSWTRRAGPPPPPPPPTGHSEPVTGRQWLRGATLLGLLILLTVKVGPWGLGIVLGLVLMIFMHELGHYLTARRAGMKVTEFFIGFGPRVWSFSRNGVEYGLKAVPAGAYVKIVGMHNLEDVPPEDEAATYRQQPFWQRFSVAVAGSAMHFAMAFVLLLVVVTTFGVPDGRLDPADQNPAHWQVGSVGADSAASRVGLRNGDKVVAIDGNPVRTFEDLRRLVNARPDRQIALTVQRDGRTIDLTTRLGRRTLDGKPVGFLGIGATLPTEKVSPVRAVPEVVDGFAALTWQSIQGLGRVFSPSGLVRYGKAVVNARRDRAAVQRDDRQLEQLNRGGSGSTTAGSASDASAGRPLSLLGVFRIGVQSGGLGGLASVLELFALINIFIGLFNLVPLLPFDGGHVVIAVYEKLQELRQGRRRRYFADVARLMPLTYVVVVVLAGIFVTSVYLDIANPISLK
ncbi:MAG: site-2 protease family protein [Actinobacteria bacterium]|nr:site-2 protease family protein [Actinomycetota bacterium]